MKQITQLFIDRSFDFFRLNVEIVNVFTCPKISY